MNRPVDALPPGLEQLIEQLVERKVEERLGLVTEKLEAITARLADAERRGVSDRATIVVFSGEMDLLMSAFIIATGAVTMGLEASMYFTFWGLNALRKDKTFAGKPASAKMIAAMLPSSVERLPTSRMNMMGIGPAFFRSVMAKNNVESLPGLIAVARELGVKLIACEMAMGVMGITREELLDDLEYGGVATYLGDATDSRLTLFI
ncbi:MAG: DsrE/DsrF/DrsH-like family protein [Myxococcales bacterium]|nr:DsrE/DsrF/DrsH-like family protein [Myxococcales bacterium]